MKKSILAALAVISLFCTNLFAEGSVVINKIDDEAKVVKFNKKIDGFKDVTVIDVKNSKRNQLASVSLAEYANMEVFVEFSCEMKIVDSTGATNDVVWLINEFDNGFPEFGHKKVASGEWTKISGSKTVNLSEKKSFYLSPAGWEKSNITVYIKDFKLKLTGDDIGREKVAQPGWLEVESLAKAYEPYFDYFGLTTPLNGMLQVSDVQDGLKHQASCFTMENEFKPDFLFGWVTPKDFKEFTAENGKNYMVPGNTPVFNNMNLILNIAQANGLKMRGHVLVWHSQTPAWFFHEDYDAKKPFVTPEVMNARMEWYIKSVLTYVREWEDKKNNGERIILAWDVVNEAASDSASVKNYLRTDSNWYKVYGDVSFITNAFRYANKYAPADVKLVYNDYSSYAPAKTQAICQIVRAIQSDPDARIDCVGMQSHIGMDYPALKGGAGSYEAAIQAFTELGVDVQVTELDMGTGSTRYNSEAMAARYKELFKLLIKMRKTDDRHGVCGVTLWGTVDERSWIYNNKDGGNSHQHPLLFDGNFTCKPAFFAVLEAAKEGDN